MARTRNEELNSETSAQIKAVARRLMAEHGTAGLSIRGIAKVMQVSPPALYHYFPKLDDLITALIVDNFNALADALDQAAVDSTSHTKTEQLLDVLLMYRTWALAHPTDFQLIYGNPIPGYVAPADVTIPAVVRTFITPMWLAEQAIQAGEWPSDPPDIAQELLDHFAHLIAEGGYPISLRAFYCIMSIWSQIHGLIMLEMFNHLTPNVGNSELFYRARIREVLLATGLLGLNTS